MVGLSKMWYNQTEVATKEELENVKGMIDVSARLVYSAKVDVSDAIPIPVEYDYAIITTTLSVPGSGDQLSTEPVLFQSNITICKGGTARVPAYAAINSDHNAYMGVEVTAYASSLSFTHTIIPISEFSLTVSVYKYTQ